MPKTTMFLLGWNEWYGWMGQYFNYRVNHNYEILSYGKEDEDYQTDVISDL
ncbi:MAG: hypothetical protein R2880_11895 [Deinococcales bacterium]